MTTHPVRSRVASGSVFLAVLLLAGSTARSASQGVDVEARPDERRVEVRVDGRPFTAYIWPGRLKKPVLFPIRTARGSVVTRGFPLEPRPGERVDHPHQVGFWLNYGDVNGVDFWNNSEALAPEEASRMGTILHREIREARGGRDRGTLTVDLDWVMPDGGRALRESASFVFRGDDVSRTIDRATTLSAERRVVLADNKEGLLGLRVARGLEAPADKPEVFTDAGGRPSTVPVLDNTGVSGVYHSSEGREGAAVWGTRGRWVALAGRVDGEDVVLLVLDHPENPGHPTYWHARGYGLFAANPLGQAVFSEGRERLDLTLEAGARTTFRHRLAILPGPFSAERTEAAWKAFAAEYRD